MSRLPSEIDWFHWDRIKLVYARSKRDLRQKWVGGWVQKTFGGASFFSLKERAKRVLEEALELAQSEGLTENEALNLALYVYGRPKGNPPQEAAGVGITLLAYCDAKGFSADVIEEAEVDRIKLIPQSVWDERHALKRAAGVCMPLFGEKS